MDHLAHRPVEVKALDKKDPDPRRQLGPRPYLVECRIAHLAHRPVELNPLDPLDPRRLLGSQPKQAAAGQKSSRSAEAAADTKSSTSAEAAADTKSSIPPLAAAAGQKSSTSAEAAADTKSSTSAEAAADTKRSIPPLAAASRLGSQPAAKVVDPLAAGRHLRRARPVGFRGHRHHHRPQQHQKPLGPHEMVRGPRTALRVCSSPRSAPPCQTRWPQRPRPRSGV